ncbi:hypothetical protein CDD83_184 [Cordyceps sp. RAO-2017]|nr:hypothetical protein CDD83_184 [Cordyceps sp. RAO-2017]
MAILRVLALASLLASQAWGGGVAPRWRNEAVPELFGDTVRDVFEDAVQDMHPGVSEPSPAWDGATPPDDDAGNGSTAPAPGLAKRTDLSQARLDCDRSANDFRRATVSRIQEGISYLRGLEREAWLPAGPNACSRVSCSWGSAIWWCNIDSSPKLFGSFKAIADAAQHIMDHCPVKTYIHSSHVGGQLVHSDRWTVAVKADTC